MPIKIKIDSQGINTAKPMVSRISVSSTGITGAKYRTIRPITIKTTVRIASVMKGFFILTPFGYVGFGPVLV